MASSSEDDIAASPPVENIMPPQPIMLLPKPPSRVYKTALDVINETIVKTLDSPHPGKKRDFFGMKFYLVPVFFYIYQVMY